MVSGVTVVGDSGHFTQFPPCKHPVAARQPAWSESSSWVSEQTVSAIAATLRGRGFQIPSQVSWIAGENPG